MLRTLSYSLLVLLAVRSCGQVSYRGDGEFRDRGPSAATDRYVLDLGPSRTGHSDFSIGALPHTEFVVGFELAGISPEQARAETSKVEEPIEISLTSDGSEVFRHSKPLRDWVWTCGIGCEGAFAYLREQGREAGSGFVPSGRRTYRLGVSFPRGLFAGRDVRLIARSGGWK
jgi:hypothetical protein